MQFFNKGIVVSTRKFSNVRFAFQQRRLMDIIIRDVVIPWADVSMELVAYI